MRANIIGLIRAHRTLSLVALDSASWFAALYFASAIRLDTWIVVDAFGVATSRGEIPLQGLMVVGVIAATCHILLAWTLRLHQGRATVGSFGEIFMLANVLGMVGVFVTVVNFAAPNAFLARTTPIAATCIALVLCAWPRGLWRILIRDAKPAQWKAMATPVLVVGTDTAGCQLVDSMLRDPFQHWRPLGFIDDDPKRRHFRFRGVPMLGTTSEVGRVASRVGATTIVIALPDAAVATIKRINDHARSAGLAVKVLPAFDESLTSISQASVRDIGPEDLLGRTQVETDVASIAGYLQGKRVLVTGAGGSIGSELCRQISTYGPSTLVLLDRDESALHALLLTLSGRADLEVDNVVLANIREADRVQEVFERYQPDVVFHAAALKHVNILEQHASEAVKTNILGTLHVLDAARAVGVDRFVNISTDKAADSINVLGHSKRVAEGLTASAASASYGTYLSVRFGNVLGTSGSVLKTFTAQIRAGGPVTVTHPDVTRYFMTVHEAVQLVIQAAAIGNDGEALVLDMGEPVKILEVARQLVDSSQDPIEIVFTGLKPGEKMHEVLLGAGEVDVRPIHPFISHVPVPPISRDEVFDLVTSDMDNATLVRRLEDMTTTMHQRLQQSVNR